MLVSFSPKVSNTRQKTNFGALPVSKIIKNSGEAGRFSSAALRDGVYDGAKIVRTEENVRDLRAAYERATDPGNSLEIRMYLKRVAKRWGFDLP